MSAELLAQLSAKEVESVREQIRKAHEDLPAEECMAWRHQQRYPSKDGGCDIHRERP